MSREWNRHEQKEMTVEAFNGGAIGALQDGDIIEIKNKNIRFSTYRISSIFTKYVPIIYFSFLRNALPCISLLSLPPLLTLQI